MGVACLLNSEPTVRTAYIYVPRLQLELEVEWSADSDNNLEWDVVSIDGEPVVGIQGYILDRALTSAEKRKIELDCF